MSTRDKFNVGVVLIAVALIVGYIVASIAFPDVNPVEFVLRMFMVFALVFGAALGGYAAFGALDDERKAKQQREGLFPYWRKESWLVYELVFPKPVDAGFAESVRRFLNRNPFVVEANLFPQGDGTHQLMVQVEPMSGDTDELLGIIRSAVVEAFYTVQNEAV